MMSFQYSDVTLSVYKIIFIGETTLVVGSGVRIRVGVRIILAGDLPKYL